MEHASGRLPDDAGTGGKDRPNCAQARRVAGILPGFCTPRLDERAQTFATEVSQGLLEKGENWEAVGMRLLDLDQVDRDMGDWTG